MRDCFNNRSRASIVELRTVFTLKQTFIWDECFLTLMRFRFNYLLWLLLPVFGSLYAYGTFAEVVHETVFPTKDIWGELFASMIVVLLIDRIIRRTELQKSERPIRYVKARIAHTCSNLAIYLKPPSDWQIRLNNDKLDWNDYFKRVLINKTQSQDELDTILYKYSYLIEPELRNDIFDIISLLNSWTWLALEEPTRSLEDDLWRLYNYANLVSALISESTETIKSHKLLENVISSIAFKEGEKPKLESRISLRASLTESQYLNYETALKEAINLRDACHKKMLKHTEKRREV